MTKKMALCLSYSIIFTMFASKITLMRTILKVAFATLLLLSSCESKHDKLQKEIKQRKDALIRRQDSTLRADQKEVERLDKELLEVNKKYAKMKREALQAQESGTATAEQLSAVTRMRMHRDSLKTQFDVLCAKIKYIRKRQSETTLWNQESTSKEQ